MRRTIAFPREPRRWVVPLGTTAVSFALLVTQAGAVSHFWAGKSPAANTSLPTITGQAIVGHTLSVSSGTWGGRHLSLRYQWQRCDALAANCQDMGGDTAATYGLGADDVGHAMRVAVTASNRNGAVTVTSAPSSVVADAPAPAPTPAPTVGPPPTTTTSATPVPVSTSAPAISGSAKQGQALTTSLGSWSGSPTTYSFSWLHCNSSGASCAAIGGANSSSYSLASSDVGGTERVRVTASNGAGSASADSAQTAVVQATPASSTSSTTQATTSTSPSTTTTQPTTTSPTTTAGTTTAGTTTTSSSPPLFVADPAAANLAAWQNFDIAGSSYGVSSHPNGSDSSAGTVRATTAPDGTPAYKLEVTPQSNAVTDTSWDSVHLYNPPPSYFGKGNDVWIHLRLYFPSGGTNGNGFVMDQCGGGCPWLFETHPDNNVVPFYNNGTAQKEYASLSLGVNSYGNISPQLFLRVMGGPDTVGQTVFEDWIPTKQTLHYDHWYNILIHVRWGTTAQTGLVDFIVDGTDYTANGSLGGYTQNYYTSHSMPTLWQRPDGSTDHPNIEFSNYRPHETWNSTVYYGRFTIATTRESAN